MADKNLFRLKIKSNGTLRGNISSNTFFGVFCQAYKILTNSEELEILLECLADNSEELTFSNPLKPDTTIVIERFNKKQSPHCMISRQTNGENILNVSVGIILKRFDVLLYTSLQLKDISKLCKIVELLGIGAQRSTGGGNIEILDIVPEELPKHSNSMTLLSNMVPDEDTPVYGEFQFVTREGKTINGVEQSSIIQIKAGSKLVNNKVDKIVYGKIIYDEKSDTFINCKAIAI